MQYFLCFYRGVFNSCRVGDIPVGNTSTPQLAAVRPYFQVFADILRQAADISAAGNMGANFQFWVAITNKLE